MEKSLFYIFKRCIGYSSIETILGQHLAKTVIINRLI